MPVLAERQEPVSRRKWRPVIALAAVLLLAPFAYTCVTPVLVPVGEYKYVSAGWRRRVAFEHPQGLSFGQCYSCEWTTYHVTLRLSEGGYQLTWEDGAAR
jgi:hypothetical protein